MNQRVIQRCVFPTDLRLHGLYHRLDRSSSGPVRKSPPPDRFSIEIGRGSQLVTDTYFNSFFESYWRRYTRLDRLQLRVRLTGQGTLLLLRRSLAAGLQILDSVEFDADDSEVVLEIPESKCHHRELGALHFDIIGRSRQVQLHRAEWVAVDEGESTPTIGLVAGYCTFNRERFVLDNIRALLDDDEVAGLLTRIVVVDQGTSKVADHPDFDDIAIRAGSRLQVIEQANFGGSGGFTRSILEARSIPGASHMLLMDDDAITEPESVFRAAAFQAMATEEMGVGGPMLDMIRPMEIYESGALLDPGTLGIKTPTHRLNAESAAALAPFLEVDYTHYNAWWFFAFPLSVLDRLGYPLPLFIRGDDVEFGYRLHQAGITTATVPGLGVWHEPFYLKRGGWQAYYDLRNMLILTCIHFGMDRKQVLKVFLKRAFNQLLCLNYYEAAILCEAAADFLRGPEILEGDPREVHGKLQTLRRRWPQESAARTRCLPISPPPPPPVSLFSRRRHLLKCLWNQLFRPSPPAEAGPTHVIPDDHARWWSLSMADVVGVEDWHAQDHRVYRRSRESFRELIGRAVRIARVLYRDHGKVANDWRAAHARLTTAEFWQNYLGIEPEIEKFEGEIDQNRRAA